MNDKDLTWTVRTLARGTGYPDLHQAIVRHLNGAVGWSIHEDREMARLRALECLKMEMK